MLRHAFSAVHRQAGEPVDAALFAHKDMGAASIVYFSPSASRIARQLIFDWAGVETAAPKRSEVALLAGRSSAWDHAPFAEE
jgi:hypothetical protein